MIDLTKSYKTRNGHPVINLVHSGSFLEGEIFFDGKWEIFAWYPNGRFSKSERFSSEADLIEVEPQYVEHTRETLVEEASYFIDDGCGLVKIESLYSKYCMTSGSDRFTYKELLQLKWANGPNKGKPIGRLQQN